MKTAIGFIAGGTHPKEFFTCLTAKLIALDSPTIMASCLARVNPV
jgi:hypothetical protein